LRTSSRSAAARCLLHGAQPAERTHRRVHI
jgi:hypothetical protein